MSHAYTKSLVLAALFAGLAYLSNLIMLVLPNISLAFFIIFMAGYILGFKFGFMSGAVGFFLISYFSPFGMALLPLLAAQVIGGGIVGVCGAWACKIFPGQSSDWSARLYFGLWGFLVSLLYMGAISIVDAMLFGPFQERFIISMGFSILTFCANIIIFSTLVPLNKSVKEIVARV